MPSRRPSRLFFVVTAVISCTMPALFTCCTLILSLSPPEKLPSSFGHICKQLKVISTAYVATMKFVLFALRWLCRAQRCTTPPTWANAHTSGWWSVTKDAGRADISLTKLSTLRRSETNLHMCNTFFHFPYVPKR